MSDKIYTFTSCGNNGYTGVTQAQVNTAYSGTLLENSVTSFSGIQKWVVPFTARYSIEGYGAQGGSVGTQHLGGKGAYVYGEFNLYAGDILYILVGQSGASKSWSDWGGGGGGASYIAKETSTSTTYKLNAGINKYVTPLLVSAGGGGGGDDGRSGIGNGQTIAGYGGVGRVATSTEGAGASYSYTTGGAGFATNSSNGYSFLNGGNGGTSTYNGGFGGGGVPYNGGGSGGGWRGGDATSDNTGNGGYSYNIGVNSKGTDGFQSGNGKVVITQLTIYRYLIENNNKNLSIDSNSNIVTITDTNLTPTIFINNGFSEVNKVTPTIINNMDDNKYKIKLYKKE